MSVPCGSAGNLNFQIIGKCSFSRARASIMTLTHAKVETPVFMPVGTQGTLKTLLPEQLDSLQCNMILANTYHLANRPGDVLLEQFGGLHKFMNWSKGLLTDSGGFQMVSLLELANITEEGVNFKSPHDGSDMLLTPEKSIEVQNAIGADIIMQLDDVVHSSTTGPRVEEAMYRTLRWLDRGIKAHKKPDTQNLFPIVQGGLDINLRKKCAQEIIKRDVPGFAIGGLSGGEEKEFFWRMVAITTEILPELKPRYLMGVGYAVDLVVCVALGCDMFDCVYPTRTARFGVALVPTGQLNLRHNKFEFDFAPIDENCSCTTCKRYTRAYIHSVVTHQPVACTLITIHNISYQMNLMKEMRNSIIEDKFPNFVNNFLRKIFGEGTAYPQWIIDSLSSVNINVENNTNETDKIIS